VTLRPERQLGIVVLVNAFPTVAPEAVADSFLDLAIDGTLDRGYFGPWNGLYDGLFGPAIRGGQGAVRRAARVCHRGASRSLLAGLYRNTYVGETLVEEAPGGARTLVLGPDGAIRLPLAHFDRELFVAFPDREMQDKPSAIQFAIGADGRAASVTIKILTPTRRKPSSAPTESSRCGRLHDEAEGSPPQNRPGSSSPSSVSRADGPTVRSTTSCPGTRSQPERPRVSAYGSSIRWPFRCERHTLTKGRHKEPMTRP
jgi:hypothetical protein